MAKDDTKGEVVFDASTGENALKPKLKRGEHGRIAKGSPKVAGRAKGTRNKVNADAKALMDELVQHGLERAEDLFDRLADKQPRAAMLALARFAEYRLPKLARIENTGPNGGPQVIEKRIYVTKSDKDKE